MDDIDRTFDKLRREDFNVLIKRLLDEGKASMVVDPNTFTPVCKIRESDLDGTGWKLWEITSEMESKIGAKIIPL